MNLVYILGNGFDKVFNLPTLYSEFYKYYLAQAPENEHVEKMKKHLEKHMYDTWADMEMGLGKYTSEISSYEELEADYHSLTMNIQAYLREVSNDFLPSTETASKFMVQFVRPWGFLLPGQLREVASFVTNVSGSHVIHWRNCFALTMSDLLYLIIIPILRLSGLSVTFTRVWMMTRLFWA